MNQDLEVQRRNPYVNLENEVQRLQAFLEFLRRAQSDTNQALDFSKAFDVQEFQLGDELLNYSVPALLGHSVHAEQTNDDFYVVCQGRVRLLSFDAAQQREVSTLVLEGGETFGADNLRCNESVQTRVLAASAGQVARIPIAKLEAWLDHLPNLRDYLYR